MENNQPSQPNRTKEIIHKGIEFAQNIDNNSETYKSGAGFGFSCGYEKAMTDFAASRSGGVQWQKCPKCDGQGTVSRPPYIAGDVNEWTSSETHFECNLCNGKMVISDQSPTAPASSVEDKFHAVEYAGYWNIQTSPYYDDDHKNILDAESIGEKEAEQYANLIAELLNKHYANDNFRNLQDNPKSNS